MVSVGIEVHLGTSGHEQPFWYQWTWGTVLVPVGMGDHRGTSGQSGTILVSIDMGNRLGISGNEGPSWYQWTWGTILVLVGMGISIPMWDWCSLVFCFIHLI